MKKKSKTNAIFFPFDLFGSAGTAAGAELLADAVREMIEDNEREKMPSRARAYKGKLKIHEFTFETLENYKDWRKQARQMVRRCLEKQEFFFWITGNHLGTLPVYDELSRDGDALVVQFDAHLDIYNLSDCSTELSHGNFLMHGKGKLPPLINVGHRELLLPAEHIERYYQHTIPANRLAIDPDAVVKELRERTQSAARIFIDLDCDVFDSAYFPALAHPQPFGLSMPLFLRLLDCVWSERVCGLAISEFAPARDEHDRSLAALMWLIEYLLLRRYE